MVSRIRSVLRHVWAWRTVLVLFLTPVLLLPLPIVHGGKESSCAYVVILMAAYWVTEALPVGVTGLLPVFLFPMLEILSSSDVAALYMNDTNMLFLGGLVVAIAIEYWDIHKRLAIRILMVVGSEPRWLLLGIMLSTWFLSIWISNAAATSMMLPIAEAILMQLQENQFSRKQSLHAVDVQTTPPASEHTDATRHVQTDSQAQTASPDTAKRESNGCRDPPGVVEEDKAQHDKTQKRRFQSMCKGMSLSICYSANAGGIASLTGTGPNLVLKGYTDSFYHKYGLSNPVTFGTWFGYGFPLSLAILIVCWLWLQVAFLPCRGRDSAHKEDMKDKARRIQETIREDYRKLGPVVFGQVLVTLLFLAVLALWITRDLGGTYGWGKCFHPEVKDGAAAVMVCVLLFALPSTLPCLKSYSDPAHPSKWQGQAATGPAKDTIQVGALEIKPLIHWRVVHQKMPWHLFLLLGGGYSMSKACEVSGLSKWIGDELQVLSGWSQVGVLFIICYVTAAATEVMSNVAISTLLMPIMSQLALSTGVHPLHYLFPVTFASSFAFMLPVSTVPNAIVFAYGRIRVIDMAVTGFILNILAVPVLVGMTVTAGNAIFHFDNVPVEFLNNSVVQAA